MPYTAEEYGLAMEVLNTVDVDLMSEGEAKQVADVITGYESQSELGTRPKLFGPDGQIISKRDTYAETEIEGEPQLTESFYNRTPAAEPPPEPYNVGATKRQFGIDTGQGGGATRLMPPPSADAGVGEFDASVGGTPIKLDPQMAAASRGEDPSPHDVPMRPSGANDSASGREDVYFPPEMQGGGPGPLLAGTQYTHTEPSVKQAQEFFQQSPEHRERWGFDASAAAVNENHPAYHWYQDALWKAKAEDWLESIPGGSVIRPAHHPSRWQQALGKVHDVVAPVFESATRGLMPGASSLRTATDSAAMGPEAARVRQEAQDFQESQLDSFGGVNPVTMGASLASVPGTAAGAAAAKVASPLALSRGAANVVSGTAAGAAGGAVDSALSAMDEGANAGQVAGAGAMGLLTGAAIGGGIGLASNTGWAQGKGLRRQLRALPHAEKAGGGLGKAFGVKPVPGTDLLEQAGEDFAIGQAAALPEHVQAYNVAKAAHGTHSKRVAQANERYDEWFELGVQQDHMQGSYIGQETELPWLDALEEVARRMNSQPLADPSVAHDAILTFYDIEAVPKEIAHLMAKGQGAHIYSPRKHPWASKGVKRAKKSLRRDQLKPWVKPKADSPTVDLGPNAATSQKNLREEMQAALDPEARDVQAAAKGDARKGLAYLVKRKQKIYANDAADFYRRFADRMRNAGMDRELQQLDYQFRHVVMPDHFPNTARAIDKISRTKSFLQSSQGAITGRTPDKAPKPNDVDKQEVIESVEQRARSWADNLISTREGFREFEEGMPELYQESPYGMSSFAPLSLEPMLEKATGTAAVAKLERPMGGSPTWASTQWQIAKRRFDALKGMTVRNPEGAGGPASVYNSFQALPPPVLNLAVPGEDLREAPSGDNTKKVMDRL